MHLVRYLLWFPITFVLLGLLAPVLGVLLLTVFVLTLPFLLILWSPFYRPKGESRFESTRELFLIWLYIIPVMMILRAEIVLIYPHFPEVMAFFDGIYLPLVWLFGREVIPVSDLMLALFGGGMLLLLILQDTLWRLGQVRNLDALPITRARSASVGLVKMRGHARSMDDDADGNTILMLEVSPDNAGGIDDHGVLFKLEDDSGSVLVDTTGARFSGDLGEAAEKTGAGEYSRLFRDTIGNRVCEVLLPRHASQRAGGATRYALKEGDPVTLLGIAAPLGVTRAGELGMPADTLMIKPRRGLFGDRYHDIFILSNGDDRPLRRYFMQGHLYGWLFVLFGLLLATGMTRVALLGLDDFEAAYGYQPRETLVAPAPPAPPFVPVLERTIETVQTPGRVSVAQLLELLHTAAPGNMIHYLGYLDRLGARDLTVDELKRIVITGNDPVRQHVAESKLREWGIAHESPPVDGIPLRERAVIDPRTGDRLTVDDMLQAIHTAPIEQVRWYLSILDSQGARSLAVNELKLVMIDDGDPARVRMARSRLASWNVR